MSILAQLFPTGMPTLASRVTTGVKAYSETPGILWARNESSAGVHVDEFEALSLSAVFAACNRMAGLKAMLPIGVYQKSASGREEKSSHSVSNLLNVQLNPEQTAFTGRFFMQFWKPLFGSACAEIGWDGTGRAARIWPLAPWRVATEWGDDGVMFFRVDGRRKVAADDMLYVPHLTEDGVTGKGFVHYALDSLGEGIAANRTAGRFFQNDMRPGGLLQNPGTPSPEARKRFREEWAESHGGEHNRHKTGVLWGGWTWIKDAGGIDPVKAQLLESRQFTVIEVARWLNVPPHWLAELGRSTWANIEHQGIETLTQVVSPLLVADEQEYDRKMLAPPKLYCKHNVNALLRGDMKTRGEFYRLMREIGAYTANDVLGLEDQNGIGEEGDKRFVPVNWQPADDLMTGGASRPSAEPVPEEEPSPEDDVPIPDELPDEPMVSQSRQVVSANIAEVTEHLLSMLCRKECNEANRATKKPDEFMKWMDGFYLEHESMMRDALAPVARLMGRLLGEVESSESLWASSWITLSREQLLDAMDGPREAWPNRMSTLLSSWKRRPMECALLWTKPLLEKEISHAP
jgi:HK97 family phage portal protein